jgi:hypothetical protein
MKMMVMTTDDQVLTLEKKKEKNKIGLRQRYKAIGLFCFALKTP